MLANKNVHNQKMGTETIPVVGIGASAGGLEAIELLLGNIDPGSGMAFIFLQHSSPTHESMLAGLLAKKSRIKVLEAENRMPVQPDHFYVIPPDKSIESLDGCFRLTERKITRYSIDDFFYLLAERFKNQAIGIILSGNATDGSYGLKAIKDAGGVTFAQDGTARFAGMPKSAIGMGVVDFVLPPSQIAKELMRISEDDSLKYTTKIPTQPVVDPDRELDSILAYLKSSKGVDFNKYKMNMVRRRIFRRMLLHNLETPDDYLIFLEKNTDESGRLINDLLINVTSFFRDSAAYDFIQTMLLPKLFRSKKQGEPVRFWIAACSTGEEAYSFAIMILDFFEKEGMKVPVQIFATDISEQAIAKARQGEYSIHDLKKVSSLQLQQYFTLSGNTYRVTKTVRDLCIFAPQNIFRDPPFARMDFISCCNLFIYLDNSLQQKALQTFHYSLIEQGYLMLGETETVGKSAALFENINKKHKIYLRKNQAGLRAASAINYGIHTDLVADKHIYRLPRKGDTPADTLENLVDKVLLSHHIPPGVVINHRMDILQFRGNTDVFLKHHNGKASLNILKMIQPELTFELRAAITKAIKTNHQVKKSEIALNNDGRALLAGIEVIPLNIPWDEPILLVLFNSQPAPTPLLPGEIQEKLSIATARKIKKLQDDLESAHNEMRSIVEDQETATEELQSANEEIVSSNEELQSINEELETSKVEIERTNEELISTNHEIHLRNEQLIESQLFIQAIHESIHEPMIVLDEAMRVKLANRRFYNKFKVRPEETEGRLFYELKDGMFNIPALRELLLDVLPSKNQLKEFEITHIFPDLGKMVLLLNAERIVPKSTNEPLVLICMDDITQQVEKHERERDLWFKDLANAAPVLIWAAGVDRQRYFFNHTWLEFTGRTHEQESGQGWQENLHPVDLKMYVNLYNEAYDRLRSFNVEYRLRRFDGEYRWIRASGKPRYDINGNFKGFLGTCMDIHEQKMLEEALEKKVNRRTIDLQRSNKELERTNNELQQFAYVASHDLQEPLRKIITFAGRIQKMHTANKDGDIKPYLDKISDASRRMSRLIDDLLNFSRSVRTIDEFIYTDLNTIVHDVLYDFDLIIKEKNAELVIDQLPIIRAIPLQMTQLFHNLISNGLKFTRKDRPVKLEIHSREMVSDEIHDPAHPNKRDRFAEITVSDNGIGFDPKYAQQIFVIFQRLHDKQSFSGTGIGLSLCKKIVNNHGGTITAHSSHNNGATFRIVLPYDQE